MRTACKILVGKRERMGLEVEGRGHLEDMGTDSRIILK
jgi:hypothetical protein